MIDEDIAAASMTSDAVYGRQFNASRASIQLIPSDAAAFSVSLEAAVARGAGGALAWAVIGTFTEADGRVQIVDITPKTAYRFVHATGAAVRVIMS